MRRIHLIAFLLAAFAMTSAAAQQRGSTEWRSLITASADGWRGYRQKGLPDGWKVLDGALTRVAAGGDIVYGAAEFEDFELEFEWKIREKGNSGVFYRAGEGTERIYENAAEYQILDNTGHPDGAGPLTVAGSNYALYGAPPTAVKPAGEWNRARIIARGAHVEHWLNGQKVVSFELWSPGWEALVKASKFAQWPSYGRAKKGMIAVQDHGDWVSYRNMRIRAVSER